MYVSVVIVVEMCRDNHVEMGCLIVMETCDIDVIFMTYLYDNQYTDVCECSNRRGDVWLWMEPFCIAGGDM